MFARPTQELRDELLSLNGIGPETADSILLYAGQHEVFVVDAYTRRILGRHGIVPETAKYEDVRHFVERALTREFAVGMLSETLEIEANDNAKPPGAHHPPSMMSTAKRSEGAQIYNEMHGLIVGVGKNVCQSRRVLCEKCPLGTLLGKPVELRKRKATTK
jgi:endonuclease-3 related protein